MIICKDCKKEYLAIPTIPLCRYCGGNIQVGSEELELIGAEDTDEGGENEMYEKPTERMQAWALQCLCFQEFNMREQILKDCIEKGYINEGVNYDPRWVLFNILYSWLG